MMRQRLEGYTLRTTFSQRVECLCGASLLGDTAVAQQRRHAAWGPPGSDSVISHVLSVDCKSFTRVIMRECFKRDF